MKFIVLLGAVAWIAASIAGVTYLNRYETTPGSPDAVYPTEFPAASSLVRSESKPTLIFFAHPKCPCTHASLNELARLMTEIGERATTYVVFIKPADESVDWTDTDTRRLAESIPGVKVVIDDNEMEARLFGAETSGLVLLYSPTGALQFHGGITSARAHEGDNAGKSAVAALVSNDTSVVNETAVFGCPLHKKDCPADMLPNAEPK